MPISNARRAGNPDRIDLQRGLAKSLVRAKRNTEAVSAWKKVVAHKKATDDDRVDLADALIRNNEWDEADKTAGSDPADLRDIQALPA